jgi:hypothetical protein
MRIDNAKLDTLIKNEGTSDGALKLVNPIGVLRLALDLKEAREEIAKLKSEVIGNVGCE